MAQEHSPKRDVVPANQAGGTERRIEYRTLGATHATTMELVREIQERTLHGTVLIVTERPLIFYAVLRRQWKRLERLVMLERARTLDIGKITGCTNEIIRLRELLFSPDLPIQPDAKVILLRAAEAHHAKRYHTICICEQVDAATLKRLVQSAPNTAHIIIYMQKPPEKLKETR